MAYEVLKQMEEDLYGNNPDNRVLGETHELPNLKTRIVVPRKGLFFADSMIVRHEGVEVSFVLEDLHQKASELTGRDIYRTLLLEDKERVQNVSLEYQALGGLWMNDNAAIADAFDEHYNDGRKVNYDDIDNLPDGFAPLLHNHHLVDIKGFEPIIEQLERLIQVQTQSQVGIGIAIAKGLMSGFECGELPVFRPTDKPMKQDDLLYFLSRRKFSSKAWIDIKGCHFTYGEINTFQVDTSGYPKGHVFTWEFYKKDGEEITLPVKKVGVVQGTGGVVDVDVFIPTYDPSMEEEVLYLGLKTGDEPWSEPGMSILEDEFQATTRAITFLNPLTAGSSMGVLYTAGTVDTDDLTKPQRFDKDGGVRDEYLARHVNLFDQDN